jgi:hypothetical protein
VYDIEKMMLPNLFKRALHRVDLPAPDGADMIKSRPLVRFESFAEKGRGLFS